MVIPVSDPVELHQEPELVEDVLRLSGVLMAHLDVRRNAAETNSSEGDVLRTEALNEIAKHTMDRHVIEYLSAKTVASSAMVYLESQLRQTPAIL
jgi:hypothetical protein